MIQKTNKLILLFILAVFCVPQLALAQGGGSGMMVPQIEGEEARGRFEYVLSKGESKQDSIIINNHASG